MAPIQPRVIRLRDAPHYLGMDANRFNQEVRPFITELPIGIQGKGFDRLELDDWVDEYKQINGRRKSAKGVKKCQQKIFPASGGETVSGTLTKQSADNELQNLLAAAASKKRKGS